MSSGSHSNPLLETWTRTSSRMLSSVLRFNRAALTAFGCPPSADRSSDGAATVPAGADFPAGEELVEAAEDRPDWDVELTVRNRDAIGVGDRVRFTKALTESDVQLFAAASGDTNPVHLDSGYADETRFGGRLVHGTLVGGLISAALARLPGSVIYLSQDLEFLKPVQIGDRVTADCEVVEDIGNDRFRLRTRILDEEALVIDGEAVVLIDEHPAE